MIYLDNNATTQLDPRVLDAMLIDLKGPPYNPSSAHALGRKAKNLLQGARSTIADCLPCSPSELIFTSGGTESLSTLIHGLYRGGRILTSRLEHSAVLKAISHLPVTYTDPTEPEIPPGTSLMIFSAVNGETGQLFDLEHIASLAEYHKISLIVDGVALLGRGPITLYPGITGMAFSGHKAHGPKGTGLIYLKTGNPLKPLLAGGGQEHNMRSGTENLAGVLGLAKAIEIIEPAHFTHMETLKSTFEERLKPLGVEVNAPGQRISNVSNLYFPEKDGELLLMQLDQAGICCSHGSACSSGALEPSHVLTEMGYPKGRVRASLRFSLSRFTTSAEIEQTLNKVPEIVARAS